jgi:hypothetical protein
VAALLTAVLAVGCVADATPATQPAEAATASPEPTPEPTPESAEPDPAPEPPLEVRGEVTDVIVNDLSIANSGLFRDGDPLDVTVPADDDAIDAHVRVAADWLDAHLTDLQTGGDGLVADAGLTGDPVELSAGLTGPDRPIDAARYAVTVGARGPAEWLRVSVTLGRDGGGDTTATFVFVPTGADEVQLVAAEPGVGTVPSAAGAEDAP